MIQRSVYASPGPGVQIALSQGHPIDQSERPPRGFGTLDDFYLATVPVESGSLRSAPPSEADVQRALALDAACESIASFHRW